MEEIRHPTANEKFTRQILPKVSRTFGLAIKFLPTKLGRSVGLAYLLCRIADTFEDTNALPASQRRELLMKYAALLENPENDNDKITDELANAFESARSSIPENDLPSIELVKNLKGVLAEVDTLPQEHRRSIFPRVQEMARGMAEYTAITTDRDNEIIYLKDEEDWDRYCYYVAGTVGHMLTDLFSDYVGFPDPVRQKLHVLGRSFGLGLQKVNILKDAVFDSGRGVCFLPQTIIKRFNVSFTHRSDMNLRGDVPGLVNTVIGACRDHFQDSLEYIKLIPRKYLGLRMFLIVPVMLAAGTLRLFADYPQRLMEKGDLKLTRKDVWRLVRQSSYCKFSNRLLTYSFGKIYPG